MAKAPELLPMLWKLSSDGVIADGFDDGGIIYDGYAQPATREDLLAILSMFDEDES